MQQIKLRKRKTWFRNKML